MDKFKAYRINEVDKKTVAAFAEMTLDELDPGEVLVRVASWSGLPRTRSPVAASASLVISPIGDPHQHLARIEFIQSHLGECGDGFLVHLVDAVCLELVHGVAPFDLNAMNVEWGAGPGRLHMQCALVHRQSRFVHHLGQRGVRVADARDVLGAGANSSPSPPPRSSPKRAHR